MATETLRPNAAGDVTQLSTYDSSTNWQNVDEETADDDTTYNYVYAPSGGSTKYDVYGLPNHTTESGAINYVKVYIRCRYSTGSGTTKAKIKTGGTEYDGSPNTLTSSYVTYSSQWNTNPKTGSAWTWDDIDALQAGVWLSVPSEYNYARCTQVYVEVDYTPVTEKTSSDAGSGADAYVSLEKTEAKTSSDAGSGAEGTPLSSATLAGSETGSGSEALVARLLAAVDIGTGSEVGGLLKDLFATELGRGSDSLTAKIEMPIKGGGMKLWT